MMKRLCIAVIGLLMMACDDFHDFTIDESALSGTVWELMREEGYETYDNWNAEWSGKSAEYDRVYLFDADHTGKKITYRYYGGREEQSVISIRWFYDRAEQMLTIESGDGWNIYRVEKMTSSTLILVMHEVQPDYEYYNREIYER